jgi:hypothetical protein
MQFFLTLLIMAITGNMIALAIHGNPSEVNFAIFVSIFSMLTLFIMFFDHFREVLPGVVAIVLDGLNVLFFFAAGVALAVALRVHSCSNTVSLTNYAKAFSMADKFPGIHSQ